MPSFTRSLFGQVMVALVLGVPVSTLQAHKLLGAPGRPAEPRELVAKPIAQVEQVLGVLSRVLEHARCKRAHGPVCALVLLVELHAKEPLQ